MAGPVLYLSKPEKRGEARYSAERLLRRLIPVDERGDSLVARIARTVGKEIIEGALAPGDQVNSVELAKRFATSRTPVREALMLLEKEGLIEIEARRRPRVASISPSQVRELYEARAINMAAASELVAQNRSEADLAELRAYLDEFRRAAAAQDPDAYFWANVAFHEKVADACGNRALAKLLQSQILRTLQLRHISLSLPHRLERSLGDHTRLMLAFEERDSLLAGALVRSLLLSALATLEREGWASINYRLKERSR